MKIKSVKRHFLLATVHFCLASFFLFIFYNRFWKWRHEIAEVKTIFITPDGANVTDSGIVWGGFAVLFGVFGFIRIGRYFMSRK